MNTVLRDTSSYPRYNAINVICLVIKWIHIKQKHVVMCPSPPDSDAALCIGHLYFQIRDMSVLKLILCQLRKPLKISSFLPSLLVDLGSFLFH